MTISNGTNITIGGIDSTITAEALAYVTSDVYNAIYGLTQVSMAAYGFALFYFEIRDRRS